MDDLTTHSSDRPVSHKHITLAPESDILVIGMENLDASSLTGATAYSTNRTAEEEYKHVFPPTGLHCQ
ncbi:hypothetical protein Tcan_12270 [Toxocara canis]|uniref:Uncharacterized protein n=1 Tax=Toxocara canis TaxID=6265 RepID=A0A0B2VQ79_TOXCA|nr:hypothetical protein Tcan_12270 [Toxocara canis]